MMRPALIIWMAVSLAAVALMSSRAHAAPGLDVPASGLLGSSYNALTLKPGYAATGTSSGVKVASDFELLVQDSISRARRVPLRVGAVLPKAQVTAKGAALCIAFPPKCIGQLAAGLAAGYVFDAALGYITKSTTAYTGTGNYTYSGSYSGGQTVVGPTTSGSTYSSLSSACQASVMAYGSNAASYNFAWTSSEPNPQPATSAYVGRNFTLRRKSDNFLQFTSTCNMRITSGANQTTTVPATEAEINTSFTNQSATWQDSTFAAVFADAVTKGAQFPITTFDGAEMVAGPSPAQEVSTTTTTDAQGQTVTQTKTSTLSTAVSGTTVGDTKGTVTERVTTVETGPNGTTTTTTDTAPQLQADTTTGTTTGGTTVDVNFPEPEFTDTDLPAVPTLYEQKYPDGLAGVWAQRQPQLMATAFVTSVQGMFPTLSGSGTCPAWILDLNFGAMGNFGTGDISPPCWIWGAIALILLTTACFTAWRIIFG